jgi:hypothetical protein
MKKICGLWIILISLGTSLSLQAKEELSIGQVADDLYEKLDAIGMANGKTLFLTADHQTAKVIRKEVSEYVSPILYKIMNANSSNPQMQALQFQLQQSNRELLSIKKEKPITIEFKLYLAGYAPSAPIKHTLVIQGDKIVISGLEIPVSSKFEKASDKSRTDFKDSVIDNLNIGKTPGKVRSI